MGTIYYNPKATTYLIKNREGQYLSFDNKNVVWTNKKNSAKWFGLDDPIILNTLDLDYCSFEEVKLDFDIDNEKYFIQ